MPEAVNPVSLVAALAIVVAVTTDAARLLTAPEVASAEIGYPVTLAKAPGFIAGPVI